MRQTKERWERVESENDELVARRKLPDGSTAWVSCSDWGFSCRFVGVDGKVALGGDFHLDLDGVFDELLWLMTSASSPQVIVIPKEKDELLQSLSSNQ